MLASHKAIALDHRYAPNVKKIFRHFEVARIINYHDVVQADNSKLVLFVSLYNPFKPINFLATGIEGPMMASPCSCKTG